MPRRKGCGQARCEPSSASTRPTCKDADESDRKLAQSHWRRISIHEKMQALRFDNPLVTARIYSTWESLCTSDLTCFMVGLHGRDATSDSRRMGIDMFGMEGIVGEDEKLLEAVFYAKERFVVDNCIFDLIERRLGSPFLERRPVMAPTDWPMIFEHVPHSWLDFVCQVLRLVEQAIYHCKRSTSCQGQSTDETKQKTDTNVDAVEGSAQSRSAKRRIRKKRIDQARALATHVILSNASKGVEDLTGSTCPVCEGTGSLLDDPCPLCEEDDDELEESTNIEGCSSLGDDELDDLTDHDAKASFGNNLLHPQEHVVQHISDRELSWCKPRATQQVACDDFMSSQSALSGRIMLEYCAESKRSQSSDEGNCVNMKDNATGGAEGREEVLAVVQRTFVHLMHKPTKRRHPRARSLP